MRRKIELYIGTRRADLDDQGLVLYNYAFTDLEKPTAVKNSFSKQITLPGTPANAAIFGHAGRVDRRTASGFHPGRKTPFRIYDEKGGILEKGYLRLDSVERDGALVKGYKVSLFGGLGEFFYALSYNWKGDKLTLADLEYPVDLTEFAINATNVKAAWSRLEAHSQWSSIQQQWDIINFAPAYNGAPSSDFAADKAIIDPQAVGLPYNVIDGGETYKDRSGAALMNLAGERDEWAAKDLRSYLQRPVLSWRAFLEAVEASAWREGIALDYSAVPKALYCDYWKTLPSIPSLGSFRQQSGDLAIDYIQEQLDMTYVARFSVGGTLPAGAQVNAKITARVQFTTPPADPDYDPYTTRDSGGYRYRTLIFLQLVAENNGVMIGGSDVKVMCDWTDKAGASLAEAVGFTPWVEAQIDNPVAVGVTKTGTRSYRHTQGLTYEVSSLVPTEYKIYYRLYRLRNVVAGDVESINDSASFGLGFLTDIGQMQEYYYNDLYSDSEEGTYSTPSGPRSGALVDPYKLLESSHTPAEYLIAWAKMHGLVFTYDPAAEKVTILPRQDFFGGDTIDLSVRIDRSKAITIQPLNLTSKWYEMRGEAAQGAFADEYENTYGQPYGIQRIDTGYDFDAKAVDIMEGLAMKAAAVVLDRSPYWNIIVQNADYLPSLFVDKGNTYTLWTDDGKTKDFQVPCPLATASITYYNGTYNGCDAEGCAKLEFRDAEGKPLDGEDVLCTLVGWNTYAHLAVTDDTALMLAINEGVPCWDLTKQEGQSSRIPIFNRYNDTYDTEINWSLDYGIPREVDIPGVAFNVEKGSLYLRFWKAYLSDLLNEDTKVMKCRVDLRGLEVGQSLLGRFFYYEGAVWVLNKIKNYSLTTWDPVECEFVQVQSVDNYKSGQILNL